MTTSRSPEEQQQNGVTLKLRDSCDACALSKLKCTKEKPTCSRCDRKKVSCIYVATKRKGRKKSSQSAARERRQSPTDVTPPLPPSATNPMFNPLSRLDKWFTARNSLSIEGYLAQTSSSTGGHSLSGSSSSYPPLLSDDVLPVQFSDLMADGNDDFTLFAPSFEPDIPNCDLTDEAGQDTIYVSYVENDGSGSGSVGSLPFFESSVTEQAIPSNIDTVLFGEAPCSLDNDMECCCMLQVLAVMKQVFSGPPVSRDSSDALDDGQSAVHDLFSMNHKAVEAIGEILKCSCSQDGVILVMLSLILLRLHERYIKAARLPFLWESNSDGALNQSPPPPPLSLQLPTETLATCGNRESLEEGDPGYMAAQRVLGELHLVQRLVNQLSTKLQEHGSGSSGATAIEVPGLGQPEYCGSSLPLSLGLFDQFDADVRRSLKSLAGEVVSTLRRE